MARFSGGWIKVYREIIGTDISEHPVRLALFIHLIAMANIEETWVDWGGAPRKCPRGSLVTSYRELAKVVGADRQSVERQLKYLASRDTLLVESETRGTFITICNYSEYQDKKKSDETVSIQSCDTDTATVTATDNTSNEELKNIRTKEVKNNNISSVVQKSTSLVDSPKKTLSIQSFEDFNFISSKKQKSNLALLYPDFEFLRREFIKMDSWLSANPKKNRKTARGWDQFVGNWLSSSWPKYQASIPSNGAQTVAKAEIENRIANLFNGDKSNAS